MNQDIISINGRKKRSARDETERMDTSSTYKVAGRTFIVQPVFQEGEGNTLTALLLNLMRTDAFYE